MDPTALASTEGLLAVVGLFIGAMAALSAAKYVIWRRGYCVGSSCK